MDHHYSDLYLFGLNVGPSKHLLWFAIAAAIVLVFVRLAIASYRKGVPSGLGAAMETLVLYVRDEIAEKNIGHDGRKYVPLLLSFFFFILVAAAARADALLVDVDGEPQRHPRRSPSSRSWPCSGRASANTGSYTTSRT